MFESLRCVLINILLPKNSPKRVGNMRPQWITIHETSLGTEVRPADRDFCWYHKLLHNESTIGYHFLVQARYGEDAVIYQFLETCVSTHHTGNSIGNSTSIGIERLVNVETDFEVAIMAQAKLAATLMHIYDIPIGHVVPHKYWSEKECPSRLLAGMYGGWDGFIEKVQYCFDNKDFIEGITMSENINEQSRITPLVRMMASQRELNGRPHLPLNPQNRKLIRPNIKDIYFFGRFCTREELSRYVWNLSTGGMQNENSKNPNKSAIFERIL